MAENSIGGGAGESITALLGLSADEFALYPNLLQNLNETYTNSLSSNFPLPLWSNLYSCIYQANSALEGLNKSTTLSVPIKNQLIGEAIFIRAFCNFYLVNIFGDVPLITTTDYLSNQSLARTSTAEVYDHIITDLKRAKDLLTVDFLAPDGSLTTDRVRPNKGAASALLSRVYLYTQKWDSAEAEASELIQNSNYELLPDLNAVFLKNNKERYGTLSRVTRVSMLQTEVFQAESFMKEVLALHTLLS